MSIVLDLLPGNQYVAICNRRDTAINYLQMVCSQERVGQRPGKGGYRDRDNARAAVGKPFYFLLWLANRIHTAGTYGDSIYPPAGTGIEA